MAAPDPTRQKLLVPLAFVVMFGWLASLCYGMLTDNFTPLTATTPVILLLAGYVFGVQITRRPPPNE